MTVPASKRLRKAAQATTVARAGSERVRLHPHGLELRSPDAGGAPRVLPLRVGSMHYWRHPVETWASGLDALSAMGLLLVDTYVPWGVHELSPGRYDFGEDNPRLDVRKFIALAHERGLQVVLRPGPHINAELTFFGLPERIVWDRACQARTPRDNPVMLPMVPLAFPVPSYASHTFHEETARWFAAVGAQVKDLRWPEGPIVMLQVDNEGALYFRDGPYDQDYHPDAQALFRAFLEEKYLSEAHLAASWNAPQLTFDSATPPHRFDARSAGDLPRHMDWMEFHEHLLAHSLARMVKACAGTGLDELPTMHNFPLGEAATPLNARKLTSIDLVGLDYYHRATPVEHATILRRTTELAVRCEGLGVPAYGAEVGAGFPPFFAPIDEIDSIYALMAALAYGLRGYNLYMAVERDRWIGAPIDPRGVARPLAHVYERLHRALEDTKFHTLRRRAPVRLVVPRSLRRLARATHAFGPATPALFNVIGAGFRESCLEEDFGLGEVATLAGEAFLRAFERALTQRGVPFAYAGGDSLDESVRGAEWIVCATVGGVKPDFFAQLRAAHARGVKVTIGPRVPVRDGSLRPLHLPPNVEGLEVEPLDDHSSADALVARRIEELGFPTFPVDPSDAFVSVHEDAAAVAKVVFVMNPTARDLMVTVALPVARARTLTDVVAAPAASGGSPMIARGMGGFEVAVPARTVRMFSVS